MALYKRKSKHEDITDKSGSPTKAAMKKASLKALELANEVNKLKKVVFLKQGENEFSLKRRKQ